MTVPIVRDRHRSAVAALVALCALAPVERLAAFQVGDPSIHAAASRGDTAAVAKILDANPAALNARAGVFQVTPLHEAARANQLAVIELLHARGAALNAADRSLSTPLHTAIRAGAREAGLFLVSHGADVTAKDSSGATPLLAAAETGADDLLGALARAGAAVNEVDATGRTALHLAAERGRKSTVVLLLSLGADATRTTPAGQTAADLAIAARKDDVVDVLRPGPESLEQLLLMAPDALDRRILLLLFVEVARTERLDPGLSAAAWADRLTPAQRQELLVDVRGGESRFFSYKGTDAQQYLRFSDGVTVLGDRLEVKSERDMPNAAEVEAWLDTIATEAVARRLPPSLRTQFQMALDAAILPDAFLELRRSKRVASSLSAQEWIDSLSTETRTRLLAGVKGPHGRFFKQRSASGFAAYFSTSGAGAHEIQLELPRDGEPPARDVELWIQRLANRLVVTSDLAAILDGSTPTERMALPTVTDLFTAIANQDVRAVTAILQRHPDLVRASARDTDGRTALHRAAAGTNLEIVRQVVARGADVNARSHELTTPLHEAAGLGTAAIAEFLLSRGAEVNAQDRSGRTPLGELEFRARTRVALGEDLAAWTTREIDAIRKVLLSRGAKR